MSMKSGRKLDIDLEIMAYLYSHRNKKQQYFSALPYIEGKIKENIFPFPKLALSSDPLSTSPQRSPDVRPFAQPSSSTLLQCLY